MGFDINSIKRAREKKANENSFKKINPSQKKSSFVLKKIDKKDVFALVKSKGPVTANSIKKDIKAETYLISAVLSELLNSKEIKITDVKRGTSIFYYIKGQEHKLEDLIQYLNEKDQITAKKLKSEIVLKDKDQELLIRVSLRKIKDYALPLNIKISNTESELFWRYYLADEEQVKEKIRNILRPKEIIIPKKETNQEETKKEKIKEIEPIKKEKTKIVVKKEKLKPIIQKPIEKEKQSQLIEKTKIEERLLSDKNFLIIKEKLNQKNIIIESAKQIRKGKEFDLTVFIDTALGKTKFYAKYKNKARCNEGDVSIAIVTGQSMNLPVAFITTGEIAKKTKKDFEKSLNNILVVEKF